MRHIRRGQILEEITAGALGQCMVYFCAVAQFGQMNYESASFWSGAHRRGSRKGKDVLGRFISKHPQRKLANIKYWSCDWNNESITAEITINESNYRRPRRMAHVPPTSSNLPRSRSWLRPISMTSVDDPADFYNLHHCFQHTPRIITLISCIWVNNL